MTSRAEGSNWTGPRGAPPADLSHEEYPSRSRGVGAVRLSRAFGEPGRIGGGLGSPFHAELGQEIGDVVLHRLLGQVHRVGDLAVGLPLGDEIEDPSLLGGERAQ